MRTNSRAHKNNGRILKKRFTFTHTGLPDFSQAKFDI
jgi:hypothetical protein